MTDRRRASNKAPTSQASPTPDAPRPGTGAGSIAGDAWEHWLFNIGLTGSDLAEEVDDTDYLPPPTVSNNEDLQASPIPQDANSPPIGDAQSQNTVPGQPLIAQRTRAKHDLQDVSLDTLMAGSPLLSPFAFTLFTGYS